MLWYLLGFYGILEHRFKTKVGEIDLICKRFSTIVFVEVKARSGCYDDVLCAKHQQKRIIRAAEWFLFENPKYAGYNLRFDLILIQPYNWPKRFKNFVEL